MKSSTGRKLNVKRDGWQLIERRGNRYDPVNKVTLVFDSEAFQSMIANFQREYTAPGCRGMPVKQTGDDLGLKPAGFVTALEERPDGLYGFFRFF